MALNLVVVARPTWTVNSVTSAHNSGDFVYEDNKMGVVVETTTAGGQACQMVTAGIVTLACPSGVTEGQALYFPTASLTAGATIQAMYSGTTNVSATIQTSSSSATLIGRARKAAYAFGASTVTDVQLAAPA